MRFLWSLLCSITACFCIYCCSPSYFSNSQGVTMIKIFPSCKLWPSELSCDFNIHKNYCVFHCMKCSSIIPIQISNTTRVYCLHQLKLIIYFDYFSHAFVIFPCVNFFCYSWVPNVLLFFTFPQIIIMFFLILHMIFL